MRNTKTAQTGLLLRLYLRRDWLKIGLWWLGLVGLMAGAAAKFDGLYGSQQAMASIITTLKTRYGVVARPFHRQQALHRCRCLRR